MGGRVDHRLPGIDAARPLVLDLIDEDHGVADDHACECDDPEDGDEAHRRARGEERDGDPDETERRHADHHGHLAEAAELHDEYGKHQRDHQRKLGQQSGVALPALFDRAAGLDQRARRHRLVQFLDRARELLGEQRPAAAPAAVPPGL